MAWIKCLYPLEHLGTDIAGITVQGQDCLTCEISQCQNKLKLLYKLILDVPKEFDKRETDMAKFGWCPLVKRRMARCTASRLYCPYTAVCPYVEHKLGKDRLTTLVVRKQEVDMLFVKKGDDSVAQIKKIDELNTQDQFAAKQILEAKYAISVEKEMVRLKPGESGGSKAIIPASLSNANMALFDSDMNPCTIEQLAEGDLTIAYIESARFSVVKKLVKKPVAEPAKVTIKRSKK